jgi:hypothetical protein
MKGYTWRVYVCGLANGCAKATDDNTQTFDTTNTGFTAFDNTV